MRSGKFTEIQDMGKLFVVPTPIGNFKDMTYRAVETLKESDYILCEDTRTTSLLLKKYEISTRLISYHMHNEVSRSEDVLKILEEDVIVSLVSDAGMPGISDPGHVLIKRAIESGFEVSVLPGASAAITALVGSGLPTDSFLFIGFLEKNRSQRKKQLTELKDETRTMILYEAPHRIREFLSVIKEILGDRKVSLCRELTKIYEEYERGMVSELIEKYETKEPRGEYVIILEGKNKEELIEERIEELSKVPIKDAVSDLMGQGLSKMDAVKKVAKERNLKKNDVYMEVTDL